MKILEFALKMEKEGEEFYREIAASAPTEGIKDMMLMYILIQHPALKKMFQLRSQELKWAGSARFYLKTERRW